MNPTAIYSKTGKGVQEASGKTSLLKRPERAVLSAIDGRATLADVSQKVGKPFDAEFEKLIGQLDKDGFVREVSPGVAPKPAPGTAKAAPPKAAPPKAAAPSSDAGGDLDFSSFSAPPKPAAPPSPPPRPAAPPPPPRPAAPPPPPRPAAPAAPPQDALTRAREEAEARAAAEKEKAKAAEAAKAGAVTAEAAARIQAEAEAKIKAAREAAVKAAAEAKAKADAEAKRGREEAEKARKESEELKQRLEDERKAREEAERKAKDAQEEAERKAKEEAERARKELEDERKRLEEDRRKQEEEGKKAEEERRKKREEEEKKAEEERAARRKREEEEEKERKRKREEEEKKAEEERAARRKREEEEEKERARKKEEERKRHEEEEKKAAEERAARRKREAEEEERRAEEERAARKKKREEEEARLRAEEEENRRIAEEERVRREAEEEAERQRLAAEEADRRKSEAQKSIAETTPARPGAPAAGGLDSLMADLDSFGKKDEEDAKAKAEAERRAKEQARRAEEEARRAEEEKRIAEERARRQREAEEEERRAEEERAARRKKREEEERREEEESKAREKKRREEEEAAEAEAKKAKGKKGKAAKDDIPVSDDDIDMDDVKRDQRALAGRKKEKAWVAPPPVAGPSVRRQPRNLGKPIALGLILVLALALGGIHVMPLGTAEYERAASEAVGRPVKIASGNIWLFSGLQLRLSGVTVGDTKISKVTAFPTFDALTGDRKTFTRVELEGLTLPQEAVADAMFAKVKGDKFQVARVVARGVELAGPLPLPKGLEVDITLDGEGAASSVTVRGPDTLVAKIAPKGGALEFDVNAGGFPIPFAPEITLGTFGMKGSATRQGMTVTEWDGTYLNGKLSGTANIRWGSTWSADGVVTARGVNAGVFAPALVSEGRGEGTAKYSLSGTEPAKLGLSGRYDATFKVESGALGGVDLSRALRTGGRETAGRTPFTEMTGQGSYDRGAVSVRNVQITQGSMNAAASADITREGALSGRVVADVRAGSQTLRSTLTLGGTARDPQFRN
jgi:hypothetical protein